MLCNSWIITRKRDGKPVLETYSATVAEKVNREAYTVETSHAYLVRLNREIQAGSTAYNA
jgi:hypothetical protein